MGWRAGFFLWLVAVSLTSVAFADDPQRAGLVVQFDDERVETRCVTLGDGQINGSDLLRRSGLDVIVDASSGMGITVCQIEEVGCSYPAEHCFCQCKGGGECAYWNYFYRDPGEAQWTYSALGAVLRKVKPGSIEAWVWGDGSTAPADDLAFEAICQLPTATPTQTPEPPTPAPTATTAMPAKTQASVRSPTVTPSSTLSPPTPALSPTPQAETRQSPASYWLFGLMALGLALVGVLLWFRRN